MWCWYCCFLFFKQKTAYEMRISDWSSDVCSSDLMPGSLDGFWLARRLRGRHPELPIILTSGNAARPDDMDGALFLPKPYDHQGLLQTIRRLLAARDRSKDDG